MPPSPADLSYGIVEDCGLRCSYHGWLFDHHGACLEQPFDQTTNPASRFREKVATPTYQAVVHAGMVWIYMGPDPAPLVPNYEPFTYENGFAQVVTAEVPCNWLQCQENSIDPVHFEWLHDNWGAELSGAGGRRATHTKIGFDEIDTGFIYRRVRTDTDEANPLWSVGRLCLWPNCLYTGNHFEWRVPIDDKNTWSITWCFDRVPDDMVPYRQDSVPGWHGPLKDPDTGRWITSHVMNQDFVAWVGQGAIADRTKELLSPSDRGIVAVRRRFFDELEAVAAGADPKGVVRDPEQNRCIELPNMERDQLAVSLPREHFDIRRKRFAAIGLPDGYIFQAGQPDRVRLAYEAAMGL